MNSQRAWRGLARLALAASFALLAWVIAFWFWQWSAPGYIGRAAGLPEAPSEVVLASGIFGPPAGRGSADAGAGEPVARGDWHLVGVLAEPGGRGWALLRLGRGGVKLLREGQEIEPGSRLVKVLPAAAEISRAGEKSILALRTPETLRAAPVAKNLGSGGCPLSTEERKRAYFVRPELLPGLAQSLDATRKLFRQEGSAWVVNQIDPALAALGLAAEDRIEKGNGVPLHNEDALRGAIVEPVMQNRVLRLTGTRGGKPREWIYVNAAICGA